MPKKSDNGKLTLILGEDILVALDREIEGIRGENPGASINRSTVIRGIIQRALMRHVVSKKERQDAYRGLLKEATALRKKALRHRTSGDSEYMARVCFLIAATRELEALSVIRSPKEETVISSLIEIIGLIKAGTGYKHLPEVPIIFRNRSSH